MTAKEALGILITHHRKRTGLTLDSLSESMGISRQTLMRLEAGKGADRVDYAVKAAEAFGINPYLFTLTLFTLLGNAKSACELTDLFAKP